MIFIIIIWNLKKKETPFFEKEWKKDIKRID